MNKQDGMNYAPKGKPQPVVQPGNLSLRQPDWITATSMACATD